MSGESDLDRLLAGVRPEPAPDRYVHARGPEVRSLLERPARTA